MRHIFAPCALVALVVLVVAAGAPAKRRHHAVHHKTRVNHPITKPTWLSGVEITEYYAVPEAWFAGQRVAAPGLADTHRVDWLYSALGLAVEGDGIDLQGRAFHVATVDSGGFIDSRGHRTSTAPAWLSGGYWLSSTHALTFPLEQGGWSAGVGVRYRRPPARLTFAPGPSRVLTPYRSLAVDPSLIALGSRVYIPAYVGVGGANGWFIAEDTGGAILGRHVDVYRTAPATRDGARMLSAQRILVEPPAASSYPHAIRPRAPVSALGGGTAVPAALSCSFTHQEAPCPTS